MDNNYQLDMTIDGSIYQHLDELTDRELPNYTDEYLIQIPMNMVDMRSSTGIINASKRIFQVPQQQRQNGNRIQNNNNNNNIIIIQEQQEQEDEPQQQQQIQDQLQNSSNSKKNSQSNNINNNKPSLKRSKDDIVLVLDGEDIVVQKVKRTDGKLAYKYYNWNSELKEQQLDEIIDLYKQYQGQSETLQKNYNFGEFQTNKSYLDKYQTQFLFDFFKLSKEVEGNQPQQQQQEQEIDEDATLVEDDGLYDQIQQDQDNQNKIKPWRTTNEDFMTTYVKNRRIFVTNLIHKGGQGSIYAGLNRKNNKLLVFKEFEREPEYIIEKNIYQKFQGLPGQIQSYLDVEGLDFDNEFYLLIVAKAECSLLDYMRMHQENYIKSEDKNIQKKKKNKKKVDKKWRFHLSDKEFTELLLFQAESMLLFQKQGIYYQDNKPDNILMKKQSIDGKTVYQMKYADFGGVFDENVAEAQFYPNCYTESYYDSELKYEKTGITYTTVNRVHNEIYTVGRTMQKSLFPDKVKSEFVSSVLSKGNVKQFGEQIALQYEQELADIFMKLVDPDYSKRYQSFEEFQQEVKTYYINNFTNSIQEIKDLKKKDLLAPQFYFVDKGNQIKNFNQGRTVEFYEKYFGEIVNINMDDQTVDRIFGDFYESSLFRESIVFLETAVKMLKNKQKKPQFKDKVTDVMLQKLQHKIGSTYLKIGEAELARKVFEKMLEEEGKLFGEDSLQMALTKSYLGDVLRELGEQEESKKILMEAEKIQYNKAPQSQDIQLSYLNLGKLYMDMKQYKMAKENFSKVSLIKGKNDKKSMEYAQVLKHLGDCNICLGEYERAKKEYEEALVIDEEIKGKNCLQAGFTLKELATVYNKLRQYEKSLEFYQKSVHIQNTYQGENHIDTVPTLLLLGDLLKSQKKIEEAKKYYEQCLEIVKGSYGDYHVQTMVPMGRLADIIFLEGELKEAKEIYEQILDIQKEHYGDQHIELIQSWQKLGEIQIKIDYWDAKEYLEKAEKILKKHYSDKHPENIKNLVLFGDSNIESYSGKKDAVEFYEKALEICKSFYGEEHIEYGELLVKVGKNNGIAEQYDKGTELIKQGLQIQQKFYQNKKDHQQLCGVYRKLGNVLIKGKSYKEAEENFRKVLKQVKNTHGKESKKTANTLYKIGQSLQGQQEYDEAEKYLKAGLNIQKKIYGKYHQDNERNLKLLCECYRENHDRAERIQMCEKLMKCQQKLYGEVCKQIGPVVDTLRNLYLNFQMQKFSQIMMLFGKIQGLTGPAAAKSAVMGVVANSHKQAKDMASQGLWSGACVSKSSAITNMRNQNEPLEQIIEARIELAHYYKKGSQPQDSRKQLRKCLRYYEKFYGERHRKAKTMRIYMEWLNIKDSQDKDEEESDDEEYLKNRQQGNEKEKEKEKENGESEDDEEDDDDDYGVWND